MARQLIPFRLKLTKEMSENLSDEYLNKLREEYFKKGFDMTIERPKDRFFSKIENRIKKIGSYTSSENDAQKVIFKQLKKRGIKLDVDTKGDILGIRKDQKPLSDKEKKDIEKLVPIASTKNKSKERVSKKSIATSLLFDEVKDEVYEDEKALKNLRADQAKLQQSKMRILERRKALSEMGKAVRRGDYAEAEKQNNILRNIFKDLSKGVLKG